MFKGQHQKHQKPVLNNNSNSVLNGANSYQDQTDVRCIDNLDTNKILCQLLKQQSAPEIDIDCFDGNPLNYRYFMAIFAEVVENRINDPRGCLTRLIKYTKGEAKELVMNCIHLPPGEGYKVAKMLLEERYGDPHRLLASYRKEIKEWQPLKIGDATSFRRFSNFLVKCQNVTGRTNWNALDNPDIICMLLSKLPGNLQDRWNRKVFYMRRQHAREPKPSNFTNFVDEEIPLLNDPMFSRDAVSQYHQEKKDRFEKRKSRVVCNKNQ